MNFMEKFTKSVGLLSKPGDSLVAKVTETGRQVIKANIRGQKSSIVGYPNGTKVITKVIKP